MKLLSIASASGPRLGVKLDCGVLDLSGVKDLTRARSWNIPSTLQEVVAEDGGCDRLVPLLEELALDPEARRHAVPETEVRLARPFLPRNIVCVGVNYRDHARESEHALPKEPILFAKWSGCASGPQDDIALPADSAEVDYEAELAVIIGRECRKASAANALSFVAGYTCMNDISARDYQRRDGQWVRAKSQDTFGPFGPYLVSRDEIADPQTLRVSCSVNGRMLQDSNTSEMIFGVRELIEFITRNVTLYPGDMISTGTPHGVGFAQVPPVFLRPGDVVVTEVERVGTLRNNVR